jgi:hypothetical protein
MRCLGVPDEAQASAVDARQELDLKVSVGCARRLLAACSHHAHCAYRTHRWHLPTRAYTLADPIRPPSYPTLLHPTAPCHTLLYPTAAPCCTLLLHPAVPYCCTLLCPAVPCCTLL